MKCQHSNPFFNSSVNTKMTSNLNPYLSPYSKVSSQIQTGSQHQQKGKPKMNFIDNPHKQFTSSQTSLEKLRFNPHLVPPLSYIKIQPSSERQFSSVIEALDQDSSKSHQLMLIKSGSNRTPRNSFAAKKSKKRFQRKNLNQQEEDLNFEQTKKRSQSHCPVEERKQLQTQIKSLRKKLFTTEKQLSKKQEKIQHIENLLVDLRRETNEKNEFFKKQIQKMNQQNDKKEKQNQDLKNKLSVSYNQNTTLLKKLQELMNESSFLKSHHGFSFIGDENSDLDLLTSIGQPNIGSQLQDEIYLKNIQIYELKKKLEGMMVREHCVVAQFQSEKRKTQEENSKRQKYLLKRIKELDIFNKAQKKAQSIKKSEISELSLLDFSFSFDS